MERSALLPSLRTGVGLKKLDITDNLDFVAKAPYNCLDSVRRASGFKRPKVFHWKDYWDHIASVLPRVETNIVMLHRVNPVLASHPFGRVLFTDALLALGYA